MHRSIEFARRSSERSTDWNRIGELDTIPHDPSEEKRKSPSGIHSLHLGISSWPRIPTEQPHGMWIVTLPHLLELRSSERVLGGRVGRQFSVAIVFVSRMVDWLIAYFTQISKGRIILRPRDTQSTKYNGRVCKLQTRLHCSFSPCPIYGKSFSLSLTSPFLSLRLRSPSSLVALPWLPTLADISSCPFPQLR